MNTQTAQLLERIWQERINQKIDPSLVLFEELKAQVGLKPSQQIHCLVDFTSIDSPLLCELLSLESSLSRAQRKPEISKQDLIIVDQVIPYAVQIASFALQFERAVSAFSSNDWSRAVEFFQRAKVLARNPFEQSACLANLIFCLENLEIPFRQNLDELNRLTQTMEGTLIDGIRSQMQCLDLREQWRDLDLSFLQSLEGSSEGISQSTYFRAYLARIPYFSSLVPHFSIEDFVQRPGHLFNKEFRLRTLTYQVQDQDAGLGRIGDFIERLYLGTWAWMTEPTDHRLHFLISALRHFPWNQMESFSQLSIDDQSLLILSMGWLSLFDSQLETFVAQFSGKLRFTERNRALIAERTAQKNLVTPSLLADSSLEMQILRRIAFKKDRIESQIIARSDLIVIDYSKNQIHIREKQRIQSKAITLSLKHLKLSKTVTVEKFFSSINGNIEFDQFLHQPQISNLIYKINQLVGPELRVRQKDGMISLNGSDQFLSLINFDQRVEMLATKKEWQQCLREFKNMSETKQESKGLAIKRSLMTVAAQQSKFSRTDIQRLLQVSKSEGHRLICLWLERKWIAKKGFGKRTQYVVQLQTEKTA
jgi:hypothetical protein